MRRKISAHVDGGPSGWSSVSRPGSEDPHRRERNLLNLLILPYWFLIIPSHTPLSLANKKSTKGVTLYWNYNASTLLQQLQIGAKNAWRM